MSNIRLGTSGHKFSFNNAGNSLRGNKFNVGGNITINAGGGSTEKDCWAALFVTNPIDDRQKILTFKGQVYAGICDWILGNNLFKSWSHVRTCSQLLWVSGKGGMGKTMLSVFLTQEFERRRQIPGQPENNAVVLYYFVDSREDKKNDATAVLRGLIYLLLRERQELMDYLLPEFEAQKDGLFGLKSIEALWRIFESMVLDASTGPVYCVIDGLDECTEDSLLHLLKKIKNFYLQQPQIFIDIHDPRNEVPGSQVPMAPGLRPNTQALKMVLVSREEPRFITEELADFPRIQVDIHRNASKAPSKPKRQLSTRAKQPTKLADIASKVMKQRQSANHSTHAVPVLSSSTPDASLVSTSTMSTSTNVTSLEGPRVLPQPTLVSGRVQLTSDIPTQQQYRPPTMDAPPAFELYAESVVHPTVSASSATEAPLPSVQEEYVMDEEVEESDEEETADSTNHEETGGDPLHLYIAAKVEELSTEKSYPLPLTTAISTAFQHRGDGTFLWVDLAIEGLKNAQSQEVEAILQNLPVGLDEMYCKTLKQVPPHLSNLVATILRWVISAKRPMDLKELNGVLHIMGFNSPDPIALLREGIDACGTMLTINDDETVKTLHTSAKDFLTGTSPLMMNDPYLMKFQVRTEEMDRDIAHICITYLEQGCMNGKPLSWAENNVLYMQRLAQYPLMHYAIFNWPGHLRTAKQPYIDLSSPFFRPNSPIRKNWWLVYWSDTSAKIKLLAPRDFTLLHAASYVDLMPLADKLLQRGELRSRLDKRDSHGCSPLDYAITKGHTAMFLFLLNQGAKQETMSGTVLDLACQQGQTEMAEHLLNLGYPVNPNGKGVHKPAVLIGRALRYLPGVISEGVDLDGDKWKLYMKDVGEGESLLAIACVYGHAPVVKMLLERNANVNAATTKGWTALHNAAWAGQIECVKLLLGANADAGSLTSLGWIPLHCAASRGKVAVVQLFLDGGISVNAMTAKQKHSLHLASYSGQAVVVKLLIERGAMIDARSYKGETALHLAARVGKPQVIELLLSMGANRSIITNDGKTALQIAKDQVGFTKEVKEGIQILETFGLPGYVPWKPTPDPKATATTTVAQETTTLPQSQTPPELPTMTNMYSPQTQDAYQVPSFQANVFMQASQPPQGSPTQYDTKPSPSPYTIPEAQGTMPFRPRFQSEPKIHTSPTSPQKPQSTGSMTPQRSQTLSQSSAQMWYPPPPPYTPSGQGNSNSQPQAPQLVIPDSPSTFSSDATPVSAVHHQVDPGVWQQGPDSAAPNQQNFGHSVSKMHVQQSPPQAYGVQFQQSPPTIMPPPSPSPIMSPPPQVTPVQYQQQTPSILPLPSPIQPHSQIHQQPPPASHMQASPQYQHQPQGIMPPPSPIQSSMSLPIRPAINSNSTYGPPATNHNPYPQSQYQYPPQPSSTPQHGPTYSVPQQQPQHQPPPQQYNSYAPPSPNPYQHAQTQYTSPPPSQPYSPYSSIPRDQPPNPYPPMNPGLNFGSPSGYLSVNYSPGVGQGKISGGLYFAPPPRQLEKKKSWRNLGGLA